MVARRLDEERLLLTALAGRPRFDTDYQFGFDGVSRDGRLSYKGVLYEVELAQALMEVDVRENQSGQITIRARWTGADTPKQPLLSDIDDRVVGKLDPSRGHAQ